MVFTLNDCLERINMSLNYPSVTYSIISHFFDQAISELNSTFRISIKPITQLIKENTFKIYEKQNITLLDTKPDSSIPFPIFNVEEDVTEGVLYFYNLSQNMFGVKKPTGWEYYNKVYGVFNDSTTGRLVSYESVFLATSAIYWSKLEVDTALDFNFLDYLSYDWIILFLIPYVCFKISIRDGMSGSLFYDEFSQGVQQMQMSYNVPSFQLLSKVAGLKAYKEDVLANIENLNVNVNTKAVSESMKTGNGIVSRLYSDTDVRGWGF